MSNIKIVRTISSEELFEDFDNQENQSIPKSDNNSNRIDSGIDIKKEKDKNRFYLPVLNINQADMWDSKPNSERRMFTDEVAKETCLSNCCGVPGLKSACCQMDPDDLEHVLGPVPEEWIKKTIKWFNKRNINFKRQDLVIDFEEGKIIGKTFFNGHKIFETPDSYPILRFQINGPRFSCKFLNNETGLCGIYPIRPDFCQTYLCQFVKKNFLVKTKSHPNTYQKLE